MKVRPLKNVKAKHLDKAYKDIIEGIKYPGRLNLNAMPHTCTMYELSFDDNTFHEAIFNLIDVVSYRENTFSKVKYKGAIICNIIDDSEYADILQLLTLLGFDKVFTYMGQEGNILTFAVTIKKLKDYMYNNQNAIKALCAD